MKASVQRWEHDHAQFLDAKLVNGDEPLPHIYRRLNRRKLIKNIIRFFFLRGSNPRTPEKREKISKKFRRTGRLKHG